MHAAPAHSSDAFSEHAQPLAPLIVVAGTDALRRGAICEMLSGQGYEVTELDTGAQLLQYLYNSVVHETRPDLVVCDAELEGIDGAQICKISRAQDSLLPFIVFARPGTPGAFDSMELSDDACVLPADVDLEELRAAVLQLAGSP
jgi:CheY-like chemotaxis protein